MNKMDILNSLISLDRPFLEIQKALSQVSLESEDGKQTLTHVHVIHILTRYINGELTLQDLQEWADEIDVRQDIEYEDDYRERIIDIIHDLSNETRFGMAFNSILAQECIDNLRN